MNALPVLKLLRRFDPQIADNDNGESPAVEDAAQRFFNFILAKGKGPLMLNRKQAVNLMATALQEGGFTQGQLPNNGVWQDGLHGAAFKNFRYYKPSVSAHATN